MFVQYDDRPIPPPRMHPWTIVEDQPEARYWNFREQPENIAEALEDFKPWVKYPVCVPKTLSGLVERRID